MTIDLCTAACFLRTKRALARSHQCVTLHGQQVRNTIDYSTRLTLNYMAPCLHIKPLSSQAQSKTYFQEQMPYTRIKTFPPSSCVRSMKYTAADNFLERNIKFYKFCITDSLMVQKKCSNSFSKKCCPLQIYHNMFYFPTHNCIPINFDSLFFHRQYLFKYL